MPAQAKRGSRDPSLCVVLPMEGSGSGRVFDDQLLTSWLAAGLAFRRALIGSAMSLLFVQADHARVAKESTRIDWLIHIVWIGLLACTVSSDSLDAGDGAALGRDLLGESPSAPNDGSRDSNGKNRHESAAAYCCSVSAAFETPPMQLLPSSQVRASVNRDAAES